MTCVPGAAPVDERRVGERRDRRLQDRRRPAGRPYLAASCARSSASIPGATTIRPRSSRASSPAAVNRGSAGQREVDLGDRARRPDVARPPEQARPDRDRVGQPGQRPLRVDAGDDGAGGQLLAVGEHDAGRPAVARRDRDDLGAGPDLDAGLARGRLERRRPARPGRPGRRPSGPPRRRRCRPSRRAAPRSCRPTTAPSRCTGCRARRSPPGARRSRTIRRRSRRSAIGRTRVIVRPSCRPRPRNVAPEAEPGERVAEPGRFDVGRRLGRDLAEEAGQRADEPVERRRSARRRAADRRSQPLGGPRRRRPTARSTSPSRPGAKARTSGPTSDSPWRLRPRSRTTDGRSRPTVWARVGTRTPGASSDVPAAPPTRVAPLEDDRPEPGLAEVGRRRPGRCGRRR